MSNYGFASRLIKVPGRGIVSMGGRWFLELVREFDGSYYANMVIEGQWVKNLPKYVNYNTLREAIRCETGISIPLKKNMIFERHGRKRIAYVDATGGNTKWRKRINARELGYDCRITSKDFRNGFTPDFTRYDLPQVI